MSTRMSSSGFLSAMLSLTEWALALSPPLAGQEAKNGLVVVLLEQLRGREPSG